MEVFENLGYFKEYWIDNKFIGIENNVNKDREKLGFFGSKTEITKNKITLSNGRVIKQNTKISTQLHYLNGIKK